MPSYRSSSPSSDSTSPTSSTSSAPRPTSSFDPNHHHLLPQKTTLPSTQTRISIPPPCPPPFRASRPSPFPSRLSSKPPLPSLLTRRRLVFQQKQLREKVAPGVYTNFVVFHLNFRL